MHTLAIDIETFSSIDLAKSSVYRYAESPDFSVLLFGYAVDDDEVTVIDVTKAPIPDELISIIKDPEYRKVAYNANFERTCLSRWLETELDPRQWECTMVHAATLGLPRTLAEVGRVLGLPEDKQKMQEGKALIQYFCKPCKPTKTNGGRTRNFPYHDVKKWETFIEYNRRDVETEREIRRHLDAFPVHEDELRAYWLDQIINDRGVMVDERLMEAAIKMNYAHAAELSAEAQSITGLDNVNSVSQLKKWLNVDGTLDKKAVQQMRKDGGLSLSEDRVLAIRQELGKTSVSKYEAMQRGLCEDLRVRGLFSFYGANRTGRWAGRQVQVQNLPQNHIPDLELAREIVKSGDRDWLQVCYGNVPNVLSELIRTAFIAAPGKTFCVADFSAIEARVSAWLADETWVLDAFRNGKDIYCSTASQMFHVPVEKHGVNSYLRQKGKIAVLACGYGGSVGAMTAMGAIEMGLKESELLSIVTAWRDSNPRIVQLWWDIDRAARETIECGIGRWRKDLPHGLSMRYAGGMLHILLPSGRQIRYWQPRVEDDGWRSKITYDGVETGKWCRIDTYGPKIFENVVQATARDCLRDAMLAVEQMYPGIVMHIHDEMVVEVHKDKAKEALAYMLQVMSSPISWAPGLPLKGDGYQTEFYKKD